MDSTTEKVTERVCPECNGSGLVRRTVQYLFAGTIMESVIAVDCPTCQGKGVINGEGE